MLGVLAHLELNKAEELSNQLQLALNQKNILYFVELLKQLFSHVPYQLHIKEEKFYHALLQIAFDIF